MHPEASPIASLDKGGGLVVWVPIQRPLTKKRQKKSNEPQYKNTGSAMKTGSKMFVGTYKLFAHPISMITTAGKHLLGNRDRW